MKWVRPRTPCQLWDGFQSPWNRLKKQVITKSRGKKKRGQKKQKYQNKNGGLLCRCVKRRGKKIKGHGHTTYSGRKGEGSASGGIGGDKATFDDILSCTAIPDKKKKGTSFLLEGKAHVKKRKRETISLHRSYQHRVKTGVRKKKTICLEVMTDRALGSGEGRKTVDTQKKPQVTQQQIRGKHAQARDVGAWGKGSLSPNSNKEEKFKKPG